MYLRRAKLEQRLVSIAMKLFPATAIPFDVQRTADVTRVREFAEICKRRAS
jgi:hypothetical protein